MNRRIGIITLGCKVNQYESEAIAEELTRRGYIIGDASSACDAYIVNTCTVTAEADRKSRQMIRRAARLSQGAPIVVTGCAAEYYARELAEIDGVIAVCGNAKKLECVDILEKHFSENEPKFPLIHVRDLNGVEFEKMHLTGFPRTRVYIKIEDGCENHCSYCAIPGSRGRVRSKLPEDVISEVKGFIVSGCREVVLTGIETASYGRDLKGVTLGALLREIDSIAAGCTVRLGSLDPSLFKQQFLDDISPLSSLAPHFHISLQSGSSKILALMRRKYNADGALSAISRIRRAIPGVLLTTDIIVGFPGETEEDFLDTAEFVKSAGFLSAHIFPYSERMGTEAATLPGKVPIDIRHERAARLIEIQNSVRDKVLDDVIKCEPCVDVLFETFNDGCVTGHTRSFLEVRVASNRDMRGCISRVCLSGHKNGICDGVISEEQEHEYE